MGIKQFLTYLLDIDDTCGLEKMSLVADPAVEYSFIAFDKQVKLSFDNEEHKITGVSILADTPIYRNNETYGEHYVVFTAALIKRMVEKFFKDKYTDKVNLEHKEDVDGVYLVESYFKDSTKGLVPSAFKDVPDGSWMTTYKIENPELWNEIKGDGKAANEMFSKMGYSIEGTFLYKQAFSKKEKELSLDEYITELITN